MQDPIVIASAARTPLGAFRGELSSLTANDLGSAAIRAAVERAGLSFEQIDDVVMGNVLVAGQGQAPARQAAIKAGVPVTAGAVTVSKVCGSGMQALMQAHDALLAGSTGIVVAGGMESMTNAPYLLANARGGYRAGHDQLYDHMTLDGLEDAYDKGRSMGSFGEQCAARYGFTREAQDRFAIASVERAQAAVRNGAFDWEIAPVRISEKKEETMISQDERPLKMKVDKIASLPPAFMKDGTITAASSSANADGAAAMVLMRMSMADRLGIRPVARIVAHACHSQQPEWFTTAPVEALRKVFVKTGWQSRNVDLFEINEAFAAVPMAAMTEHDISHDRVNVHGGACILGHPIGASGARIVVTLLGALKQSGGRRGVATLCIGGGEATAMAVELL
ncbi:acetyl-CoA C-acyltransferase [Noviherbaspirillum galbum]|uniref:Acetyl-CoA C-acyltransferase n=1 Tax=Noviherbaspirillum galbum TaxID=2709383 RepID=A0A6B3SH37_9BURK|nr:acetyl-CoA C-acyltransferase [Noviherbaspirillum galbum]NEX59950.1 acetyl-CoA C-acyltransferase [Noviherbaspirillum galbum]